MTSPTLVRTPQGDSDLPETITFERCASDSEPRYRAGSHLYTSNSVAEYFVRCVLADEQTGKCSFGIKTLGDLSEHYLAALRKHANTTDPSGLFKWNPNWFYAWHILPEPHRAYNPFSTAPANLVGCLDSKTVLLESDEPVMWVGFVDWDTTIGFLLPARRHHGDDAQCILTPILSQCAKIVARYMPSSFVLTLDGLTRVFTKVWLRGGLWKQMPGHRMFFLPVRIGNRLDLLIKLRYTEDVHRGPGPSASWIIDRWEENSRDKPASALEELS